MKRQIILLMTDTTRCDMLGCYGNADMRTPNLDRLAAEGLRYTNAYTCQPVCGPARSAIFTGTFPHSNGMVTNSIAMGDNVKTIGQRLSDNGVHCGYIGKWHLDGGDYFGNGRCPEEWDERYWYDMRCYLDELTDEERRLSRQSSTAYRDDMTAEFTYAHRCSDRALKFLDENSGEDFFLTVSYDEPHGPCLCPAPFNKMYDGVSMPKSENYADDLSKKPLMQQLWSGKGINADPESLHAPSDALALFLGCNSFADMEIGRVLDKIREKCPDALVIYTSDHGDMLGNHRLQMKNAVAYKEVANIPLLIKCGAKGVINAPASHIDIAPTVLDYMGVPVPKLLEGKSMVKQLRNPDVKINDVVFTEFTRYEVDHDGFGGLQPMRTATDGRFKLVLHLTDTDEFYDMQNDPAEVHNLINDENFAEQRDALHDKILQHMNDTRDLYRGYQWLCRPWRKTAAPTWENDDCTRQRENEEYEPRQLDYDTGLPMETAVRSKRHYDEKTSQ
ncbi:MAG: sulfatase-like hydrolase/transferase [Ruminococcaceae bacterium]|nr:sulfatase-like hydrolase/transferase [Oscillospiraceae bacterium]